MAMTKKEQAALDYAKWEVAYSDAGGKATMTEQTNAGHGAVAGQVERPVRPARGDEVPTYDKDGVTAWKCLHCDKEHTFSAYVMAHWRDELTHTCTCGAQHSVLGGLVKFKRA